MLGKQHPASHALEADIRAAQSIQPERISIINLFGDAFRCNLYYRNADKLLIISKSYFVVLDDKGAILTCDPPLSNK